MLSRIRCTFGFAISPKRFLVGLFIVLIVLSLWWHFCCLNGPRRMFEPILAEFGHFCGQSLIRFWDLHDLTVTIGDLGVLIGLVVCLIRG